MAPYPAVDGILYEVVHEGGDGRVKDKGDKEEKPKDTIDGESTKKQWGVVLDIIQTRLSLFFDPHGGVYFCHHAWNKQKYEW